MSLSQFATAKFVTRKRATWVLIGSFLIVTAAQPTAQGLDFPTTTRLNLPEGPAAKITFTKDADLNQAVTAPISEMAQVAAMARQVELARKSTGAKYVARTIMLAEYSWGDDQYSCLNRLWTKESHWNYKAHNSRSGAHGIPQALPASKMDVVGTDWRTNPVTQIRWGLRYIDSRYSTPCKAWAKFKRAKYY
jgi:hypothetical protein